MLSQRRIQAVRDREERNKKHYQAIKAKEERAVRREEATTAREEKAAKRAVRKSQTDKERIEKDIWVAETTTSREERNRKRLQAVKDIAQVNLKGFSIEFLTDEYPELFGNKTQAHRYLTGLRYDDEVLRYEVVDGKHLYFKKPDTYDLLTKLWA